ncbi:MAG: hypothetical protein ACLUD0_09320 [Eubacterium ramulus]
MGKSDYADTISGNVGCFGYAGEMNLMFLNEDKKEAESGSGFGEGTEGETHQHLRGCLHRACGYKSALEVTPTSLKVRLTNNGGEMFWRWL